MTGEQICRELEQMHARGARPEDLLEAALRLLYDASPEFHWSGVYGVTSDGILKLGPFVATAQQTRSVFVGRGTCVNGGEGDTGARRFLLDAGTGRLVIESETRGGEPFMILLPETRDAAKDDDSGAGGRPLGRGRPPADPAFECLRMLGYLASHDADGGRKITEWRRSNGRVELVVVASDEPIREQVACESAGPEVSVPGSFDPVSPKPPR